MPTHSRKLKIVTGISGCNVAYNEAARLIFANKVVRLAAVFLRVGEDGGNHLREVIKDRCYVISHSAKVRAASLQWAVVHNSACLARKNHLVRSSKVIWSQH